MKQKIIISIFTIVIVALTFSCAKDSFKETIGICSAVIATSTLNEETNVDLNKVISVTFNEAI